MTIMNRLPPLLIAHLFPKIESALIDLLRSLTAAEWESQTVAPAWKVKDVAAHLLDTQLRKLSVARDGYRLTPPTIVAPADLVAFVNRLNHEGVTVYRRLSPSVLIALMDYASADAAAYYASLDPHADAVFAVSWAGEERSRNWFDTAREYTERWHHQQQIRLATNKPGIVTRELYYPVLDCFMRALPHAYRSIRRAPGTAVVFNISGNCGGTWHLVREENGWALVESAAGARAAETTIPQDIAWRIFTKGIDRDAAARQVHVSGDPELAGHVLGMIAIIG